LNSFDLPAQFQRGAAKVKLADEGSELRVGQRFSHTEKQIKIEGALRNTDRMPVLVVLPNKVPDFLIYL
jgi:hypothetical protein